MRERERNSLLSTTHERSSKHASSSSSSSFFFFVLRLLPYFFFFLTMPLLVKPFVPTHSWCKKERRHPSEDAACVCGSRRSSGGARGPVEVKRGWQQQCLLPHLVRRRPFVWLCVPVPLETHAQDTDLLANVRGTLLGRLPSCGFWPS